jgi:hypothetical protein
MAVNSESVWKEIEELEEIEDEDDGNDEDGDELWLIREKNKNKK